eukprot:365313-Chlamydomonas_euryale.AAC.41
MQHHGLSAGQNVLPNAWARSWLTHLAAVGTEDGSALHVAGGQQHVCHAHSQLGLSKVAVR